MVLIARQPGPSPEMATSFLANDTALMGCHGGAGTTTLCRLLVRGWDLSGRVGELNGRPLILVARGTPSGTWQATTQTEFLSRFGIRPRILAIVGDGPWPEPRTARARIRLLESSVDTVVRVPYVSRWRYLDDPLSEPIPRKILKALHRIRDVLEPALPR